MHEILNEVWLLYDHQETQKMMNETDGIYDAICCIRWKYYCSVYTLMVPFIFALSFHSQIGIFDKCFKMIMMICVYCTRISYNLVHATYLCNLPYRQATDAQKMIQIHQRLILTFASIKKIRKVQHLLATRLTPFHTLHLMCTSEMDWMSIFGDANTKMFRKTDGIQQSFGFIPGHQQITNIWWKKKLLGKFSFSSY